MVRVGARAKLLGTADAPPAVAWARGPGNATAGASPVIEPRSTPEVHQVSHSATVGCRISAHEVTSGSQHVHLPTARAPVVHPEHPLWIVPALGRRFEFAGMPSRRPGT
ncbi:hypothetical protein GCM10027615_55190 [Plantactinospora veratri]